MYDNFAVCEAYRTLQENKIRLFKQFSKYPFHKVFIKVSQLHVRVPYTPSYCSLIPPQIYRIQVYK